MKRFICAVFAVFFFAEALIVFAVDTAPKGAPLSLPIGSREKVERYIRNHLDRVDLFIMKETENGPKQIVLVNTSWRIDPKDGDVETAVRKVMREYLRIFIWDTLQDGFQINESDRFWFLIELFSDYQYGNGVQDYWGYEMGTIIGGDKNTCTPFSFKRDPNGLKGWAIPEVEFEIGYLDPGNWVAVPIANPRSIWVEVWYRSYQGVSGQYPDGWRRSVEASYNGFPTDCSDSWLTRGNGLFYFRAGEMSDLYNLDPNNTERSDGWITFHFSKTDAPYPEKVHYDIRTGERIPYPHDTASLTMSPKKGYYDLFKVTLVGAEPGQTYWLESFLIGKTNVFHLEGETTADIYSRAKWEIRMDQPAQPAKFFRARKAP